MRKGYSLSPKPIGSSDFLNTVLQVGGCTFISLYYSTAVYIYLSILLLLCVCLSLYKMSRVC